MVSYAFSPLLRNDLVEPEKYQPNRFAKKKKKKKSAQPGEGK
jgi:hypothetical protein